MDRMRCKCVFGNHPAPWTLKAWGLGHRRDRSPNRIWITQVSFTCLQVSNQSEAFGVKAGRTGAVERDGRPVLNTHCTQSRSKRQQTPEGSAPQVPAGPDSSCPVCWLKEVGNPTIRPPESLFNNKQELYLELFPWRRHKQRPPTSETQKG